MVKLTAVQIWKYNGPDKDPFLLGNAADLSSFGFFQRGTVGEMLTFVGRTVARKTQVRPRLQSPGCSAQVARRRLPAPRAWRTGSWGSMGPPCLKDARAA